MLIDRRKALAGFAAAAAAACTNRTDAAGGPNVATFLDRLTEPERQAIAAGTSDLDCGPAFTAALGSGDNLRLPAGRYRVKTPIVFRPRVSGRFAPGVTISGDGVGRTIIEDITSGRALFDFDSGADQSTGFRAITDVHLEGFTIQGNGAAASTAAIRMRGCYQSSIRRVHIIDRPGDGVVIPCLLGDIDGSNMVTLDDVRVENCKGWGISAVANAGHNEISFLRLLHVFVQNCGTRAADPVPRSGGMRYKGQVLDMDQCAFALNQNVGLFIPGEAGLAVNARLSSTAFENNVGRHLLCSGISGFRGSNLQFFSNDQYRIETACDFDAVAHTVRGVAIDGVLVRATTANTPYVAFSFKGPHLIPGSNDVRNVIWDDFGHPGQTRIVGIG